MFSALASYTGGKPLLHGKLSGQSRKTDSSCGNFPLREIGPKASRLGQNYGGPKTDEPRLWLSAKTRLSLSWAAGGAAAWIAFSIRTGRRF